MINKKEKENLKDVAATLSECYYALDFFLNHTKVPCLFEEQAKRLMQRVDLTKTSIYDMIASKNSLYALSKEFSRK